MASPDKTPLERLSWLQRQSEEAEVVIVREADLAELEAVVVRLQQEAETWKRRHDGAVRDIEARRAVVVRLREALRGLMACLTVNENGLMVVDPDDWAEPWAEAVAVVSPDKPPEPRCDNCRGKGYLNENGYPTVPGRADSYECQECGGSGVAVGGEQE